MKLMACLLTVYQKAAMSLCPSGVGGHLDLIASGRQLGEAHRAWVVSATDGRRPRWMLVSCCRAIRVEAGGTQVALAGVCSRVSMFVQAITIRIGWRCLPHINNREFPGLLWFSIKVMISLAL